MNTNDVVAKAVKVLEDHGIETLMIIVKDPDSRIACLDMAGDREFLTCWAEMARDIMKGHIYNKAYPNDDPPGRGSDDDGEGWKP